MALVEYCGEEEPIRMKVIEDRRAPPPVEFEQYQTYEQQMDEIRKSTLVSAVGATKIRRCFLCVIKATELGKGHARLDKLCRNFFDKSTLSRHFISFHLDSLPNEGQAFKCPICRVRLIHKNHLRVHAEEVHGIRTDGNRKMRYKGPRK